MRRPSMKSNAINHNELYRLPWSLSDNAISWLEPTSVCNMTCDGCYRENVKGSHKSLQEVKKELDTFQRLRKSDCISIAGGDPLVHPQIIEIVRDINSRGLKPILNTNGKALDLQFLKELKKAGVFGFTFHIDSKQSRGKPWDGKNELELNELRLYYAQMLAEVGGIACSFNSTVYEDTIEYIPGMIQWAQDYIDIVHTMVFIAFRNVVPNLPFDWFAGGRKIDFIDLHYHSDKVRKIDIKSTDMLDIVREEIPEFTPAAFLNGTLESDAFKWMLTERIGVKSNIFGYPGPKFIELVMATHHFLKGKYLSYISPRESGLAKTILLLWPFDKGVKHSVKNYFFYLLKNPLRIFKKIYFQTIMFIQPVDFLIDGSQSMCDGCPDITIWNDQLVWSCRLEELKYFNTYVGSVLKT